MDSIPTIDGRKISWVDHTGGIEASDLTFPVDHHLTHIDVRSHKTGVVVRFSFFAAESSDGDIICWNYIARHGDKALMLQVFND